LSLVENLIGPEKRECEEEHDQISECDNNPKEKIEKARVNYAES
jgi:hypothetical protein